MMITHQQVDAFEAAGAVGQDASWLLQLVKRECWGRPAFYLANGFEARLGWSLKRLRAARKFLVIMGEVIEVRRHSKRLGPTIYKWPHVPMSDALDAVPLLDGGRSGRGV